MKKLLIITLITAVGVGSLHSRYKTPFSPRPNVEKMSMDQLKEALDRTKKKVANLRQQLRTANEYDGPGISFSIGEAENVVRLLQKTIKKRMESGKS